MTTDQALRDPEHGPRRATLTARPKIVQRFAWSVTGRARAVMNVALRRASSAQRRDVRLSAIYAAIRRRAGGMRRSAGM